MPKPAVLPTVANTTDMSEFGKAIQPILGPEKAAFAQALDGSEQAEYFVNVLGTEAINTVNEKNKEAAETKRKADEAADQAAKELAQRASQQELNLVMQRIETGAIPNRAALEAQLNANPNLTTQDRAVEPVLNKLASRLEERAKQSVINNPTGSFTGEVAALRTNLDGFVNDNLISPQKAAEIMDSVLLEQKTQADKLTRLVEENRVPEEQILVTAEQFNDEIQNGVREALKKRALTKPEVKATVDEVRQKVMTEGGGAVIKNLDQLIPQARLDTFTPQEQIAIQEEFDKIKAEYSGDYLNTHSALYKERNPFYDNIYDALSDDVLGTTLTPDYQLALQGAIGSLKELEIKRNKVSSTERDSIQADMDAKAREKMWAQVGQLGKILGPVIILGLAGGGIGFSQGKAAGLILGALGGVGVGAIGGIAYDEIKNNGPQYRKAMAKYNADLAALDAQLSEVDVEMQQRRFEGMGNLGQLAEQIFIARGIDANRVRKDLPDFLGYRNANQIASALNANVRYARAA